MCKHKLIVSLEFGTFIKKNCLCCCCPLSFFFSPFQLYYTMISALAGSSNFLSHFTVPLTNPIILPHSSVSLIVNSRAHEHIFRRLTECHTETSWRHETQPCTRSMGRPARKVLLASRFSGKGWGGWKEQGVYVGLFTKPSWLNWLWKSRGIAWFVLVSMIEM